MSRPAYIEVRPVSDAYLTPTQRAVPPSRRPHYIRKIGGDGKVKWCSESYSESSTAHRAAKKHAEQEGLEVLRDQA